MLLARMVIYALSLGPAGFLISTIVVLVAGSAILGERKWHIMVPVAITLGGPAAAPILLAGVCYRAILLMILAPALSSVALLFHLAGYFALMVVGLSAIAAFAGTGQVAKALMMTILGLIMPTAGGCAGREFPSRGDGPAGPWPRCPARRQSAADLLRDLGLRSGRPAGGPASP